MVAPIHDPIFVRQEQTDAVAEDSIDTFIELREKIEQLRSRERELKERDIIPGIRLLCMSAAQLIEVTTCRWSEDDDGNYETACGETHIFMSGTPSQNQHRYCPYCGREIIA